ncbi:oxygenase MpaB family protein [Novosphingobium sp.]|uniref:oxygenase MpaB family protein n=1 Tax=Novosphingobium sp. TaxID=1874826 RepID=UPI0035B4E6E7
MQDSYQGQTIDFASPAGEPALLAPDSLQWRIYKNQIALGIGGIAAVLLEFADPRIRSGVWDHSTYKADPIGRSRRTGTVALLACYGPASQARAVIGMVNRMHGKVKAIVYLANTVKHCYKTLIRSQSNVCPVQALLSRRRSRLHLP